MEGCGSCDDTADSEQSLTENEVQTSVMVKFVLPFQ